MEKQIRCSQCRYAQPDPTASKGKWTAYECSNRESDYYRALLNITEGGAKQDSVTWTGCECGVRS